MKRALITAVAVGGVVFLVFFLSNPLRNGYPQPPARPPLTNDWPATEVPLFEGDAPSLLIRLPPDMAISPQHAPDFDVIWFTRNAGAHMGLYVGHAPSPLSPSYAFAERGTISGRPVTWRSWQEQTAGSKKYYREFLLDDLFALTPPSLEEPPPLGEPPPPLTPPPPPPPPPSFLEHLTIHLFIVGTNPAEVYILYTCAETIHLKR